MNEITINDKSKNYLEVVEIGYCSILTQGAPGISVEISKWGGVYMPQPFVK